MIRIEIEAQSARELQEKLMALAIGARYSVEPKDKGVEQADSQDKPKVEVEEKPTPKPRKTPTKAEEPKPEPSEEAAASSALPVSGGNFDVEGVDPTNKDSVRAYLSQSIDILTGAVVTQVFSEFGATSFKGIASEQYAPMIVRLDELRKAAEAEAAEKGA